MKLWEVLKLYDETGCKIKPEGFDGYRSVVNYNWSGLLDIDWSAEPEPKKTVVMYQFAAIRQDVKGAYWHVNIGFYENEDKFRKANNLGHWWKVKRLDYTKTEFEV